MIGKHWSTLMYRLMDDPGAESFTSRGARTGVEMVHHVDIFHWTRVREARRAH